MAKRNDDFIKRVDFAIGASLRGANRLIKSRNANAIKSIGQRAEQIFRSDILRPQERGQRSHRRQTGSFSFVGQGATFRGFETQRNDSRGRVIRTGFGYPNVARADARTDFVWRSLEFGLGPRGEGGALAPRGQAKFPKKFTFVPFGNLNSGVLIPRARGSAPVGQLIHPRARGKRAKGNQKAHPGIAPKAYIRRAGAEVIPTLKGGYTNDIATAFKREFNK